MKRFALFCSALLFMTCGSPPEKGTASNDGNYVPPVNVDSSNQPGTEGMERGSPDNEVVAAYNQIIPALCAFDATCPEPEFGEVCETMMVPQGELEGQCFVVDQAKVDQCEGVLSGMQCEDGLEDLPLVCLESVRECECLDGFERGWTDDGSGCFRPCSPDGECSDGLCYDGVCTPEQEGRCPDNQLSVFDEEGERCADRCEFEGDCPDGEVCNGRYCEMQVIDEVDAG